MKLRSAILLGILLLVGALLGATIGAVTMVVGHANRKTLETDVTRGRDLFEDLQVFRRSLFHSQAGVTADEPRLKAVVNTEDIDHPTIVGVATDVKQSMGADLLLITDADGKLLADAADPKAEGGDMSGNPLIATALKSGQGAAVWIDGTTMYQVEAHRMDFGTQAVGVVAIGYKVDDKVAEDARKQVGSAVVIELDGAPVAMSALDDGSPAPSRDDMGNALAAVKTAPGSGLSEATVNGERYLVTGGAFPGYSGDKQVRYLVLRSLDRALAPAHRLTTVVLIIGGLGLLAAVLIALLLARGLAKPVAALVSFTERVRGGDVDARAQAVGTVEVRSLGTAMNRMLDDLAKSRMQLVAHERLQQEMEIATRIQTSLVPRDPKVDGLELAATMIPADEVGGDYYDVQNVEGGCWIGVGDVAGHGLPAGLVMLMVQSAVAALVRAAPDARPEHLLATINRVIYDNVKGRLDAHEHVTFSLLRYWRDGRVAFAGAHQEILVCRSGGGVCERITTPGTWLGMVPDLGDVSAMGGELQLSAGDLMVLYTDGVTEAQDPAGEQFGIDRLAAEIERHRAGSAEQIRDGVKAALKAWSKTWDDDVTIMVIRYGGAAKALT